MVQQNEQNNLDSKSSSNSIGKTVIPTESTPLIPSLLDSGDITSNFTLKDVTQELRVILGLSIPNVTTLILSNLLPMWTSFSLGKLGTLELGAGTLGNTLCALTGICLLVGMVTSLDTLCSQAFTGSQDKTVLGVYLQRGILVCSLTLLPVTVVWWQMGSILTYFHTDPALVALIDSYLKWRLIGLFPSIVFECLKRYLQAQGIVKAPVFILLLVTPIGIVINYYLVIYPPTSIGFIGAPIAYDIATWLSMFMCILYIFFIDGKQAWGGFSSKAFYGWSAIFKLGVGGMIMSAAEWWSFGSMALVVPIFGTASLAAHSVMIALGNMFFMPHLGVSISASIRIGNHLGSRFSNRAKLASYCCYFLGACTGLFSSILLGGFSNFWANAFSNDPEVVRLINILIPVGSLYQLFDSFSAISGGILRGQGRQSLGARVILIGFYIVAIPLGLVLGFTTSLQVLGIWIGFVLGLILCCTMYLFLFYNTNWDDQVQNTIKRLSE